MTGDSLSVFSRVRLYTAIYPEGDVADSTESFFHNCRVPQTTFPVLSLRDLPLKRLPSVNPLRYQSPIALSLGAKLKISPRTIAQVICQGSVATSDATSDLDFSCNEMGWITVTWESAAMVRALAGLCEGMKGEGGDDMPFWLWRSVDRVQSLRAQLRSLHPEFDSLCCDATGQMPDPVQGLLEAMVIFFDRRSEGKASEGKSGDYRSLCDAFEQMYRQIPLFSVVTSVDDRYAVWLVLGWFQKILPFRETTDK